MRLGFTTPRPFAIRMPHNVLKLASRAALSLLFVGAGALHFRAPGAYLPVMPPYLPQPLALIYLSGAAELAGGLGVWPRATRRWAGWGLLALLLAVFPANLEMALHGTEHLGWSVPRWVWWARLPGQPLLMAWVWSVTQGETQGG